MQGMVESVGVDRNVGGGGGNKIGLVSASCKAVHRFGGPNGLFLCCTIR